MNKVQLTRKKFAGILLSLTIMLNVLVLYSHTQIFIGSILLLVLLLLPGFLILLSIHKNIPKRSVETLMIVIGLSLTFLILGGLLINTIGPLIGVTRPLDTLPLMLTYDVLFLILITVAVYRHPNLSFVLVQKLGINKFDIAYLGYGLVCLLIIMVGSQILNSGAGGGLVIAAFILLAIYIIAGVLLHRKLSPIAIPVAIFIIGFSLLLSYSLRSNYVFGWDINQEFGVFQLTNLAKHWSIAADRGPYNACLSITILPAALNSLTKFSGDTLFKFVLQGIFALVPVVIYRLTTIILPVKDKRLGFLAAVIFVSQTWFIMQAPILVRQEISLFFFSVLLLILLKKSSHYKIQGVVFGLMVILSHYSTAYVMLSLFILYILLKGLVFREHPKLFPARVLLLFLLVTFLWQYQMTRTAGNLTQTLAQTFTSLPQVFSSQGIGSSLSQISFASSRGNIQQNINSDYKQQTIMFRKTHGDLYPSTTYKAYQPSAVSYPYPPSVPIVQGLPSFFLEWLGKITKIITSEILPLVGIVIISIMTLRKKRDSLLKEYALLSIASLLLLAVMLVLPLLKGDYNLTRLWLQALIIFSPLVAFAGYKMLYKLRRINLPIVASLFSIFFLYSSGLITYATSGVAQAMYSNESSDYYMYYTTKGETLSARWMSLHANGTPIYADQLASLKLAAFGNIEHARQDVYPSTITTTSMVYEDETNLDGVNLHYSNNSLLRYLYPNKFISSQKDELYSNNSSEVYGE
jgi:uncharacterized membrane protein